MSWEQPLASLDGTSVPFSLVSRPPLDFDSPTQPYTARPIEACEGLRSGHVAPERGLREGKGDGCSYMWELHVAQEVYRATRNTESLVGPGAFYRACAPGCEEDLGVVQLTKLAQGYSVAYATRGHGGGHGGPRGSAVYSSAPV